MCGCLFIHTFRTVVQTLADCTAVHWLLKNVTEDTRRSGCTFASEPAVEATTATHLRRLSIGNVHYVADALPDAMMMLVCRVLWHFTDATVFDWSKLLMRGVCGG